MVEFGCDRKTTIIALGGGVVGDVSGFVASSFMRGIDYYQIPTTLLAMVDSSIGGKTGINIAEGKNLVGAIYQPKGVLIDPVILESLPQEEVFAGLGEIIKYGAIWDKAFLIDISTWLEDIDSFPFEDAIRKSCKIKAEVVSKDEREGDLRRILNFGHTIGHALESHLGYGKIRHGEAVALGMKCAGFISEKLGLISKEDNSILSKTIAKLPLPDLPHINGNHLLPFIRTDKKSEKGVLNFVVLDGLGNAIISTNVTEDLIKQSLTVLN
jgi:3-dehydroquinate synthase